MFSPEAVEAQLPERSYRDQTHPRNLTQTQLRAQLLSHLGGFFLRGGLKLGGCFYSFQNKQHLEEGCVQVFLEDPRKKS